MYIYINTYVSLVASSYKPINTTMGHPLVRKHPLGSRTHSSSLTFLSWSSEPHIIWYPPKMWPTELQKMDKLGMSHDGTMEEYIDIDITKKHVNLTCQRCVSNASELQELWIVGGYT